MKPKKALHFYNDTYFQSYIFLRGWSREQVNSIGIDTGSAGGITASTDDGIIIWIEDLSMIGNLVHECDHATNFTLSSRGVKLSLKNDEPHAYLITWIFNQCYNAIPKKLKK